MDVQSIDRIDLEERTPTLRRTRRRKRKSQNVKVIYQDDGDDEKDWQRVKKLLTKLFRSHSQIESVEVDDQTSIEDNVLNNDSGYESNESSSYEVKESVGIENTPSPTPCPNQNKLLTRLSNIFGYQGELTPEMISNVGKTFKEYLKDISYISNKDNTEVHRGKKRG